MTLSRATPSVVSTIIAGTPGRNGTIANAAPPSATLAPPMTPRASRLDRARRCGGIPARRAAPQFSQSGRGTRGESIGDQPNGSHPRGSRRRSALHTYNTQCRPHSSRRAIPIACDAVRAGQLVRILEQFAPMVLGVFLYYPGHRQTMPKLRAFIDRVKSRSNTDDKTRRHGDDRASKMRLHGESRQSGGLALSQAR